MQGTYPCDLDTIAQRMLRRDNSEYQWFRERAASIHTNLQPEYPISHKSMASHENNPNGLNPEPADPQERDEHHLEPKSYADAVQEAAIGTSELSLDESYDGINFKHTNGIASHDNNGARESSTRLDTKPEDKPSKLSHTTNTGNKLTEDKIVYEKFSNGDGTYLTSVRPDESYEESLKHNKEAAPKSREPSSSSSSSRQKGDKKLQDTPRPQLQSGRRAGAGWEQSAYVICFMIIILGY